MSATPIPRTLALIAYGDLDVSVIGELPPGRRPVETFLVSEALRERLNGFIRRQCSEGHQVYVVCPAVEESEDGVLRSAEAWAQTLQQSVFPDLRVGLLHGKMKSAEKKTPRWPPSPPARPTSSSPPPWWRSAWMCRTRR